MRTLIRRFALALSISLLAAATCAAQSNLASVSGVVSDPQNAVIPGARITVTHVATGVQTAVSSNSAGFYGLQNLPIGVYSLAAEHEGFRKYIREGIPLSTGQQLGLDIRLELGATGQSITITAEAPLVESRTSGVGALMESKSIEWLPLANRKTLNVVALSGAAVFVDYPNTPSGSPSFSLAGGRRSQMAWIDGGSVQNSRIGNALIDTDAPAETVAEVKLLTNSYSAEYGASASGVVIETTKSGTNQLHGSVYDDFRNNAMDAPGFFAPVVNGQKVSPELRYNAFGATAGGPVRKNKTFYFASYEGARLRGGSTIQLTVPTLLQRQGDFSQTLNSSGKLVPIYDPASTATTNGTTTRQLFANNVIPKSQLDPVAMAALDYYPLPNQAPSNLAGANNFSGNQVSLQPSNFVMGKVDQNFSDKDRAMFRYIRQNGQEGLVSVYPNGGAGNTASWADRWAMRIFATWVHTISSTQVNDFRFAYNDRLYHQESAGLGGNYPSKLGVKGVSDNAFPQFSPAGFSGLGSGSQERVENPIRTWQYIDTYSWNRGRHAIKFGGEVRRSFHGDIQLKTGSGSFGFSTQPTGLPGNTSTGNGLASMLTGFVTSFGETATDHLYRHMYYFAGFVQDDWNVTPSLTLNLGLRWETDTPMIADDKHMNSFDPNQINPVSGTPGVVKFMGLNGYTNQPYAAHWTSLANWGPRIGFAWKVFGSSKTVIRGGGGLFAAHPFENSVGNTVALGFGTQISIATPDNGITPAFYLRNGVPVTAAAPALDDTYGAVKVGQSTTTSVQFFEPHRGAGYSQQFNLGIQRELPGSVVLEITGLGNLSRKLANDALSLNQIAPQILGPGHSSQKDRPFPQFTDVQINFPTLGYSNYYAGMIRVERRYSKGLSFGGTYTWSKYLGNDSMGGDTLGNGSGIYSDLYNRRADYGPVADDVVHRANFHWLYELPFGTGKRWLSASPLRFVAGGWSLGNVTTFQTGAPNTVTTQTNNCNCFSAGSQRPNVVGDSSLSNPSVAQWFNTAAFAQPAAYTMGNAGAGIIRSPGLINLDFSVQRSFRITERIHADLRGEFFDAFNHTNFSNPGTTLGSSTFGVISSVRSLYGSPGRMVELGARILF